MITEEKRKQILACVMGLMYYYGAMRWADLYEQVEVRLAGGLAKEEFRTLLAQTALDDGSRYVFEFADDICFDFDVDDSEWVLTEQAKQSELIFRPVNEHEAAAVVSDHYTSLWSEHERAFYNWLEDRCGHDHDLALALFLEYASLIKNGLEPLELVKRVVAQLEISAVEEMEKTAALIVQFVTATPLWTLKGWRRSELMQGEV
ncbi:MAG: hypothetical protein NUK65_07820 [Firmicutes bacterium]|nr:hypothetical protein [Bacillota bacterium]